MSEPSRVCGCPIMSQAQNNRNNNFDFLRQFAAFLVILGHSQSIVGVPQYGLWGHGIATIGVLVFFSLSGYLVTLSWIRDPNYMSFFVKRSLRIFPALVLCVVFSALVLGPAVTKLDMSEYFSDPNFRSYFFNIVLQPHYNLPGVFTENVYPNAVNGSLWSLPVEYACYILVVIIALGRGKISAFALSGVTCLLLVVWYWYTELYTGLQIVIWATDLGHATSVMPYFLVGATLCVLRDKIAFRWDVALSFVLLLVGVEHLSPGFSVQSLTWILVPYIVLTIGWANTPVLSRFGRFGDPSYGMYLYAFPVQQSLVYLSGNQIGFVALTFWTTAIVIPLGMLSWHMLEKPALSLKSLASSPKSKLWLRGR